MKSFMTKRFHDFFIPQKNSNSFVCSLRLSMYSASVSVLVPKKSNFRRGDFTKKLKLSRAQFASTYSTSVSVLVPKKLVKIIRRKSHVFGESRRLSYGYEFRPRGLWVGNRLLRLLSCIPEMKISRR